MQGVGRSVRGADKRDHRGEKFDVLACHFQFWDKAKCFTEWPHQSTRGKVAPSIILRCYELACLPRVTQGLEPPLLGQRRLWPMFIRIGKHLPDFFCRLTERPACFHHDKLHAIARPAFVAVVCSAPILVVEAESVLTSAGWAWRLFSGQIAWRYAKLRKNGRPAIDALICYTNHHAAFRFAKRIRRDLTKARSEEHTSELQSLMRISYPLFFFQLNISFIFI